MNANHTWWNSQIKSPKCPEEIVQIMERNHFFLHNELDTPIYYYQTGKGTPIFDCTFNLQSICNSGINGAVDDNASTGSDHAAIRFDIVAESGLVNTNPNTIKYNWNNTDWDIFSKLSNSLPYAFQIVWQYLHKQ
jgi:hypothetical protein